MNLDWAQCWDSNLFSLTGRIEITLRYHPHKCLSTRDFIIIEGHLPESKRIGAKSVESGISNWSRAAVSRINGFERGWVNDGSGRRGYVYTGAQPFNPVWFLYADKSSWELNDGYVDFGLGGISAIRSLLHMERAALESVDSIEGYHPRADTCLPEGLESREARKKLNELRRQITCEEKIKFRAHHEKWIAIWLKEDAKERSKSQVKKGLALQTRASQAAEIWRAMQNGFAEVFNQPYHRCAA